MPQHTVHHPLLTTLTQQATKALTALYKEITQRERELAALKVEAARWQSVMRGPARKVGSAFPPSRIPLSRRPRLDWGAVLKELPTRFTTQEVVQKAGKPIEQVYVHVWRWMKDKKVRKVEGGYQKVSKAV